MTYAFALENTGRAALRIEEVKPSYSCTAVHPPERILPGESAELEVECDTEERTRRLVDTLVVRSNDPGQPLLALHIEASIEPRLAFESRTVDVQAAFGTNESGDVRLTGTLSSRAHLHVDAIEPPGPDVTVLSASDGRPEGLRVACARLGVGRVAGQVRVSTGIEKPSHLELLYTCQINGNLRVEPTNPFLDLRAPGGGGVVVRVTSSRPDFRLDRVEIVEGPFEATFARDPGGLGYSVSVRLRGSELPKETRGAVGKLRLVSNDPAEPRKEVPLFALGPVQHAGSGVTSP